MLRHTPADAVQAEAERPQRSARVHISIWVGNLPERVSRDELVSFFGTFPGYLNLFYMRKTRSAFVNFAAQEDAERAAVHFHGVLLKGSRIVARSRLNKQQSQQHIQLRAAPQLPSMPVASFGMLTPLYITLDDKGVAIPPATYTPLYTQPYSPMSIASSLGGPASVYPAPNIQPQAPVARQPQKIHSRYFVMKSVSAEDMDFSMRHGVWATQLHLEALLDNAYRSAENVYLIFSVNKSGQFCGFARMASPIHSGHPLPPPTPQNRTASLWSQRPAEAHEQWSSSAEPSASTPQQPSTVPAALRPLDRGRWGRSFQVQWILAQRLPFACIRHLHNPWNNGREVKVSRDGTELEPSVGHAVITEFYRFLQHQHNMMMQGQQLLYVVPGAMPAAEEGMVPIASPATGYLHPPPPPAAGVMYAFAGLPHIPLVAPPMLPMGPVAISTLPSAVEATDQHPPAATARETEAL